MLLLLGAIARIDGNADFASPFWPQLQNWAKYLEAKGFDPENQLCTDDFAGHLAHNVNLSAKAILALASYGLLCEYRGEKAEAARYHDIAVAWPSAGSQDGTEGDHTRLAFDRPDTWSQKYNLVWDKLLKLDVFPAAVIEKEIAFYLKHQDKYGLPLDNRKPYAKLDWTVWTATMAEQAGRLRGPGRPAVRLPRRVADPRPDDRLVLDQGRQAGRVPGPIGRRRRVHQAPRRHDRLEEVGEPRQVARLRPGRRSRPRRRSGRSSRRPATGRPPGR